MSDTAELPLADLPPGADEPAIDIHRPTGEEHTKGPVHGPELPSLIDHSLVPPAAEDPPTDDQLIAGLRKELESMSPDNAESHESPLIPILEERLKEKGIRRGERKHIMKQIYQLQHGEVQQTEKPKKEKVFRLAKIAGGVAAALLVLMTFMGFKSAGGRQQ